MKDQIEVMGEALDTIFSDINTSRDSLKKLSQEALSQVKKLSDSYPYDVEGEQEFEEDLQNLRDTLESLNRCLLK